MSVKEINPRGALGRLTRSAFARSKGLPTESDMDDSAALSNALNELDELRTALAASEQREVHARSELRTVEGCFKMRGEQDTPTCGRCVLCLRARAEKNEQRIQELEGLARQARNQAYSMFGWLNFPPRGLCICHDIREAEHHNVGVDAYNGEELREPSEHCFECDEYVALHATLKQMSPALQGATGGET